MITEDYVSFEVSKLLKEKGFDGECSCYYFFRDGDKARFEESLTHWNWNNGYPFRYSAPTLQMAMKWLRNIHNIHFVVEPFTYDGNKIYYGVNVLDKDLVTVIYENLEDNTYEQACEEAIKYCLENLI